MVAMLPGETVRQILEVAHEGLSPEEALLFEVRKRVKDFFIGDAGTGCPDSYKASYVGQMTKAGVEGVLKTLCEIMADRAQ